MGISRHHTWTDIAALDEHLAVFLKLDEALESFLVDFESSSHEPYKIRTDSGSVNRPSRTQISEAVDSLGGSLNYLNASYRSPDGSRWVSISAEPFPGWPVYRIASSLNVSGDDDNETNGRFNTLRNRMDAEIKRQWPKTNEANQKIAVLTATTPETAGSTAAGFTSWLGRLLRHPTGSAMVGGLVATIIGGLVVVGIVAYWR